MQLIHLLSAECAALFLFFYFFHRFTRSPCRCHFYGPTAPMTANNSYQMVTSGRFRQFSRFLVVSSPRKTSAQYSASIGVTDVRVSTLISRHSATHPLSHVTRFRRPAISWAPRHAPPNSSIRAPLFLAVSFARTVHDTEIYWESISAPFALRKVPPPSILSIPVLDQALRTVFIIFLPHGESFVFMRGIFFFPRF